jgi:hypothetical protein
VNVNDIELLKKELSATAGAAAHKRDLSKDGGASSARGTAGAS